MKDLDRAIKIYEEVAVKQGESMKIGADKTANKCYAFFSQAQAFTEKQTVLARLKRLLIHPSRDLRICAAEVLPIFEKEALNALKQVAKSPEIGVISARHIIWLEGNGCIYTKRDVLKDISTMQCNKTNVKVEKPRKISKST